MLNANKMKEIIRNFFANLIFLLHIKGEIEMIIKIQEIKATITAIMSIVFPIFPPRID